MILTQICLQMCSQQMFVSIKFCYWLIIRQVNFLQNNKFGSFSVRFSCVQTPLEKDRSIQIWNFSFICADMSYKFFLLFFFFHNLKFDFQIVSSFQLCQYLKKKKKQCYCSFLSIPFYIMVFIFSFFNLNFWKLILNNKHPPLLKKYE